MTLPNCYRCGRQPCECRDGVTLYRGDALHLLPHLPPASIDAIITDPPYSSGGQFRSDRSRSTVAKYVNSDTVAARSEFSGDNRDQRGFLAWASLWFAACHHAAKPGAIVLCFTDWRQLPVVTDAVQCGGWVWRGLATWHKPGCRMQRGRFSASAEYIVYASSGIPNEGEQSPQNVFACAPVGGDEKVHIAEKPDPVLRWLIGLTRPGDVILDPFCGSGVTLRAARDMGRRAIGIEIEDAYCLAARRRLRQRVMEFTG